MIDREPQAASPSAPSSPEQSPAAPKQKTKKPDPLFRPVLGLFTQRIDALARSLPLMVGVLQVTEHETAKGLNAYLEKHGTVKSDDNEKGKTYTLTAEHIARVRRLRKRLDLTRNSKADLPRTYIIALVSQFDAFLGRLIRTLFLLKPEMLNASEKSVSFKQLLEIGSLDEAREYVIEKEVESVLRDSHTDHFKWLEARCGLPLRKELPIWSTFIEVTERRNLFVHTGGVVTSQYLKVCRETGVKFEPPTFSAEPKPGEELGVTRAYFDTAYRAVFEVGFKLSHVLWRKMVPEEREAADSDLIDLTYEVIVDEDYELACVLLSFALTTIKTFSSEDRRLRIVLNCAQAHKWAGRTKECAKILADEDWTATSSEFQLAVAVLSDDFSEAAEHMRSIGPRNSPTKSDYRDWPIFREFRKSQEFKDSYLEVFGEPFVERIASEDEGEDIDLLRLDRPRKKEDTPPSATS